VTAGYHGWLDGCFHLVTRALEAIHGCARVREASVILSERISSSQVCAARPGPARQGVAALIGGSR